MYFTNDQIDDFKQWKRNGGKKLTPIWCPSAIMGTECWLISHVCCVRYSGLFSFMNAMDTGDDDDDTNIDEGVCASGVAIASLCVLDVHVAGAICKV